MYGAMRSENSWEKAQNLIKFSNPNLSAILIEYKDNIAHGNPIKAIGIVLYDKDNSGLDYLK